MINGLLLADSPGFFRGSVPSLIFRIAADQAHDPVSEVSAKIRFAVIGIFDNVMQNSCSDNFLVVRQLGCDRSGFQRM